MAETNPIKELIAEDIKAKIAEITEGNGFNYTLSAVRAKRSNFLNAAWADLTVIINQTGEIEMVSAGLTKQRDLQFVLTCIYTGSDESTVPLGTPLNRIAADIEKKLMEDPTRDGNAIDTVVHGSVPKYDSQSGVTGVFIEVSVHYRTKDDDPYTKG